MASKKISQFTPTPGIDSSVILAGIQNISGNLVNTKFTIAQIGNYIDATSRYPRNVYIIDRINQTGSLSSMGGYTSITGGMFMISMYIKVRSVTSGSIQCHLTFHDESNDPVDSQYVSINSTGFFILQSFIIRVYPGTTINISSVFSGTSINYDYGINFQMISL